MTFRSDKTMARQYGVPKWLRRYCKRYGSNVFTLTATHKKFPVGKLDHGADRGEALRNAVMAAQRLRTL